MQIGVLGAGAFGLMTWRKQSRVDAKLQRGKDLHVRQDGSRQAVPLYREAIALDPQNAEAWGRFAR